MQHQRAPFFKPLKADHQVFESKSSHILDGSKSEQQTSSSGERLSSLHAKLHEEADKIRKWKNQVEMEIVQKDKKILEGSQTIDHLRKSVLDVQMKNESLSMHLQEEISNREEIMQKIYATRHLFSVLKDHITSTENRLDSCEGKKDELKSMEQTHQRDIESLLVKFTELENSSMEKESELQNKVEEASSDIIKLKELLDQQTAEAEAKLHEFSAQLKVKDSEIEDMKEKIQRNEEKCHHQEQLIDSFTSKTKELEEKLENSNEKYAKLLDDMSTLQATKVELEATLSSKATLIEDLENQNKCLQAEFSLSSQHLNEQIQSLQDDLEQQKSKLGQKQDRLLILEADLSKIGAMVDDINSTKDNLLKEKIEMEGTIKTLEEQNAVIDGLKEEAREKQEQVEQLTQQINLLQTTQQAEIESHEKTKQELSDCQTDLSTAMKDLMAQKEEIEKLTLQLKNKDELQSRLNTNEIAASEMEAETKALKSELAAKNKQIKQLEKRIQELDRKWTSSTKQLGDKKEELSKLKLELTEEQKERKSIEQKLKESESQITKTKALIEKTNAEKVAANQEYELQRTQLMQMMENYKLDNDKHLADKVKEVQTLKAELDQAGERVKTIEAEVEQLRNTIAESGHELGTLQKTNEQRDIMFQNLERENMKKDEELKHLQQQLGMMYIKSTTKAAESPCHTPICAKIGTPKTPRSIKPKNIESSELIPKTPRLETETRQVTTPTSARTPQRSILKDLSANSASKKRRVVFAMNYNEDSDSSSGESCTFEVSNAVSAPPPKPLEKAPSFRKVPSKSAGKFFKKSSSTTKSRQTYSKKEKEKDLSWVETDDIFGFACED